MVDITNIKWNHTSGNPKLAFIGFPVPCAPCLLKKHFMSTLTATLYTERRAVPRVPESQALAAMLMAAVLAALLVVADQLIETWSDGHLLASWVALWLVAFAALAGLAQPLRELLGKTTVAFARHAQEAKARRIEAQLWECAHHDRRVMADVMQAWQRSA
jgi:hypothetical protein